MSTTRTITYRDAVTFSVPDSWKAEDHRPYNGSFFDPRIGFGTLTVSVYGFETVDPDDDDAPMPPALLDTPWQDLPRGVRLFTQSVVEARPGADRALYRWVYQIPLTATSYRVILFTYSVPAIAQDEAHIVSERVMLDASIRNAQIAFDPVLPVLDKF